MALSLVEARENEAKAREIVQQKQQTRDDVLATIQRIQDSIAKAKAVCTLAQSTVGELEEKLSTTKDDVLPNEAISRRTRLDLEAAQSELAKAREERIAAEAMLVLLEKERDQAEQLLSGARQEVEKSGENASSSKEDLNRNRKLASDAQHAVDDALRAIDEAKAEVERIRVELIKARKASKSLPHDNSVLSLAAKDKRNAIEKDRRAVEEARKNLEDIRNEQLMADAMSKKSKDAYERAQEELRRATAELHRSEAALQLAKQLPGLDKNECDELRKAEENLQRAVVRKDEAAESNKKALSDLADADVEAIRLRIAGDEAKKALAEAQERFERTETAHSHICEEIARTQTETQVSSKEVASLERKLAEELEELDRLEQEAKRAQEQNQSAQEGLRSIREMAMRYGRESRNAISVMDGRRHKVSDVLSAIEVGKTQLESLKRREAESAARVDAAYVENQRAYEVLTASRGFIVNAEQQIMQKRQEIADTEERIRQLEKQMGEAEESLMRTQKDLEVAQADLTDAEVSVIMAEIDSHIN